MSPRLMIQEVMRAVPLLHADQDVYSAAWEIVRARAPALRWWRRGEVRRRLRRARVHGRPFPRLPRRAAYAALVPDTLDEALERRSQRGWEPVSKYTNTEHVDADPRCSDAQLAETFLHHRVPISPIVERGEVKGIITRGDSSSPSPSACGPSSAAVTARWGADTALDA